jgi:general secretion pathway protein N
LGHVILRLAGVLVVVLATVAIMAPAAWLADFLEARSPVRLVHPSGTVWRGSAQIAFSDGQRLRVLPGRVIWRTQASGLLSGRLAVQLQHDMIDRPIRFAVGRQGVQVEAGAARVPAALLAAVGAPFNTIRPGGTLRVQWDNMRVGQGGFTGSFEVDWRDAQSALSTVAPLGSYRLTATGRGGSGEAELVTLRGPLLLSGRGSLDGNGIRFSGVADAQADMRSSLDGFIGLLGRRVEDHVLLEWEIRK